MFAIEVLPNFSVHIHVNQRILEHLQNSFNSIDLFDQDFQISLLPFCSLGTFQILGWYMRMIVLPDGNPRETESFKKEFTRSDQVRRDLWARLLHTSGTVRLRRELGSNVLLRYRSDAFGNVVSLRAREGALCRFHVDHLFPWSRGGASVFENAAAVHHFANRHVKRDHIYAANEGDLLRRMSTGLQVPSFVALYRHVESIAKSQPTQADQAFVVAKFDFVLQTRLEGAFREDICSIPANQLWHHLIECDRRIADRIFKKQ